MANDRPNVLWYCADQMRFDAIGALGNPHAALDYGPPRIMPY